MGRTGVTSNTHPSRASNEGSDVVMDLHPQGTEHRPRWGTLWVWSPNVHGPPR